jgi:hypothetical protein
MRKRKLYLHAGIGKTGSSALQLYFHKNAQALADHGIRYPPGEFDPDPNTGISSGNGFIYFTDNNSTELNLEQTYTQLLDDGTGRDVLLSSEQFAELLTADIIRLLAMCENLNLELVPFLFIRDAEPWYQSAYHQIVKRHGYTGSFQQFIEEQPHRYPPALIVERFEAVLPAKTLRVFSYEEAVNDIVPYVMWKMFGIDPPGEWANPTVNRSLTRNELIDLIRKNREGGSGYETSNTMLTDHPIIPSSQRHYELIPAWFASLLRPDIKYLLTKLAPSEMVYATNLERTNRPKQMVPVRRAPKGTAR